MRSTPHDGGPGADAAPSPDAGASPDAAPSADAASSPDASVEPDGGVDAALPSDAGRDAGSDAGRPRLGPPYPIVLAHGFFGFDELVGFVDYFYRVREALEGDGETLVFTPEVDPFNSSAYRGHQLIARIEDILAQTGHDRVILIGHSQGGLDARVVAQERPELLAAVVTLATPHGGSEVADIVLGVVDDPLLRSLLDALVNVIGAELYDEVGNETSVFLALEQFSSAGVAAFDDEYWDDRSVPFYSIAGRSGGASHSRTLDCQVSDAPPFIRRWDREDDPIDPLLSIPELLVDGANDGLVSVQSSRIGRFLGCVPADHLDEVGQLFGDRPGLFNDFDYRELFVELVRWLREQGY